MSHVPAVVSLHVWGVGAGQIPAAITRVARDRITLRGYPGLLFAKVLGTGSGVTFAPKDSDPRHWALLTCWDAPHAAATFEQSRTIRRWDAASTERVTVTMTPLTSTGRWSGRQPFGPPVNTASSAEDTSGPVAAITRARIHWHHLPAFWRTLPSVTETLAAQPALIWSLAIGEAPIALQGTFSVWQSLDAMDDFAYRSDGHREAIQLTQKNGWFSEELFARFRVLELNGIYRGRTFNH